MLTFVVEKKTRPWINFYQSISDLLRPIMDTDVILSKVGSLLDYVTCRLFCVPMGFSRGIVLRSGSNNAVCLMEIVSRRS